MASLSAPLAKLTAAASPSAPAAEVDDFDLAWLRALATGSRQSQRALAPKVESSPAVADRLARLRVRDRTHLRAVADQIFQIGGVQPTETFPFLAAVEPGRVAAPLGQRRQRRSALGTPDRRS